MNNSARVGLVNIKALIDEEACYRKVRELRWPEGVKCPSCDGEHIIKQGRDQTQKHRQKYQCKSCHHYFDDLTDTIFAGHHQPLFVWILCLYFMGLNLSNLQIAQELDLNVSDVQIMASQLREGVVKQKPEAVLEGIVEFDEMYVVAGHKGHPGAVKKRP